MLNKQISRNMNLSTSSWIFLSNFFLLFFFLFFSFFRLSLWRPSWYGLTPKHSLSSSSCFSCLSLNKCYADNQTLLPQAWRIKEIKYNSFPLQENIQDSQQRTPNYNSTNCYKHCFSYMFCSMATEERQLLQSWPAWNSLCKSGWSWTHIFLTLLLSVVD